MPSNLQRRLDALERRLIPSGGYAIQFLDDEGPEPTLWVSDEEMPFSTFRERYPYGQIVKVLTRELWEAI